MRSLEEEKEDATALLDSISEVVKRTYNECMYLVVKTKNRDSAAALRVCAMIKVFALAREIFHDPIIKVTRGNIEPNCILNDEVWLELPKNIIIEAETASFYVMVDNEPVRSFDQIIKEENED
jgi:hypothetical protein